MANYDALRHLSIGEYIPLDSLIHRLDPRAKLAGLALLMAAAVIASSYAASALLVLTILALARLARLPLRYALGSVKPALPVLGIIALMQLLFYGSAFPTEGARPLLDWGPMQVTTDSLRAVVVTLARFLALICLASLLTNTTPASALTHGLERLLQPLSAIGLPGHEIAFAGAIALRFMPILGEQLAVIARAQEARRVRAAAQSRWRLAQNARDLANLVAPLFVDAYRRAEELILAMRARCYQGGRGRTHLAAYTFARRDALAVAGAAVLLIVVILIQRLGLP